MLNLVDIVIYEELKNNFSSYLLDNLRIALHCWEKTGDHYNLNYHIPKIFESYKYNFDNCSEVVKEVMDYLENTEITDGHTRTFKFDNVLFFNKLQLRFTTTERSAYIKSKSKKGVVYLQIQLLNKPFEEYELKERRFVIYSLIHELTHAYEDYLIRLEGKPSIIYLMKGKYMKDYRTASKWMYGSNLTTTLAKCKYFLDDHEMVAYLGTVQETVKNIFDKIKPSYKDLKFDELLDLFKDEYVWNDYIKLNVFMESLDDIDPQRIVNAYKVVFRETIDYDDYTKELKDKWERFKSEFVEAFIEAYADCEEDLSFEGFVSPPMEYFLTGNPFFNF